MPLSSKQLKALKWYLEEHEGLRLQLSSPPMIYFKDKHNKVVSVRISEIASAYELTNEEDKKERARDRRQNRV